MRSCYQTIQTFTAPIITHHALSLYHCYMFIKCQTGTFSFCLSHTLINRHFYLNSKSLEFFTSRIVIYGACMYHDTYFVTAWNQIHILVNKLEKVSSSFAYWKNSYYILQIILLRFIKIFTVYFLNCSFLLFFLLNQDL